MSIKLLACSDPIPSSSKDSSGAPAAPADGRRTIATRQRICDFRRRTPGSTKHPSPSCLPALTFGHVIDHQPRARNSNTILRRIPVIPVVSSRVVSAESVTLGRRQRKRKLPNPVFHPHTENKIFPLFPWPDPLIAGCEKNPSVNFAGFAGLSMTVLVSSPCVVTNSMNSDASFSYSQDKPPFFHRRCFGILLNLALGFEDQRVNVILQPIREVPSDPDSFPEYRDAAQNPS